MKILTADAMRRLDRQTVERGVASFRELMEGAGREVAGFLTAQFPATRRVTVLCGKGNNGGDGLVAARRLRERGLEVRAVLFAEPSELKGDARASYDAFLGGGSAVEICATPAAWRKLRESALACDVVVDAMLGTGLANPVEGLLAEVIRDVNSGRGRFRVLAVDIPSGVPSDSGEPMGEAIQADVTLTFTAPKRGVVLPPNAARAGTLAIAPIGTPEEWLEQDASLTLALITARRYARWPLARDPAAHKGDFGHALLVAGSRGKTGAAALAGKAALRAGAGLVTVATAASSLPAVASLVPEMMTEPLAETDTGAISSRALDYGRFAKLVEGKTVVAMGPGLGTHPETVPLVRAAVEQVEAPLVLDADALNALVGQLDALRRRRARWVAVTPHPGEMARLVGTTSAEVQRQRLEVAQKFARDFGVFVILKGYRTLVAAPEGRVCVNASGNPGMATGGAGDVLTGLAAGLVAQWPERDPLDVLSLAVYLHGLGGDLAAALQGEQALIASDITEAMPGAWRALREKIERDQPGSCYVVP